MLPKRTSLFILVGSVASFLSAGCEPSQNTSQTAASPIATNQHTTLDSSQDVLDRGIASQGGLAAWQSYGALEYDIVKGDRHEHHLIDLHNRKMLITGETYQMGYDGVDVWVTPGLEAFPGSARFSKGLDFYFFVIPFVLADPGTNREILGRVTLGEKEYEAVRVSFEAGVGDSPDDVYIAHFDPDTHRLRVLLYTVTFRSQQPNENFNARVYETWQEVGDLTLPRKVTSYQWNGVERKLGEKRVETIYNNVRLHIEPPDSALFARPAEAEIDTPPTQADL